MDPSGHDDQPKSNNAQGGNTSVMTPADKAKSWQGTELYPGVDSYVNSQLHYGDKIYILESDYEVINQKHSGYATTYDAVVDSNYDSRKLSESLQIKPYYDEVGKPDKTEYRSQVTEYTVNIEETLEAFDITRSLSHKGCPHDNAVAETTFKIIKIGFVKNQMFVNLDKLQLTDYVNWFNNCSIYSALNYLTPVEYWMSNLKKVVPLTVDNPNNGLI